MTEQEISWREMRLWVVLMLLLLVVPYVVAWWVTPADKIFLGSLINPLDHSVYLAAMRQGAEGHWLFRFEFSPEPVPPRLTYPLYLLMGRLSAAVGGSLMVWFHLFRLLSAVAALGSMAWWVRRALPGNGRSQWTAWLLTVFGGGVGWLVAILWQTDFKRLPDLSATAFGSLMPMLGTPHFTLGLGLEAVLFGCVLQMGREEGRKSVLWAGVGAVTAVLIALIHTFSVPVIGLVIGFYMLALAIQKRAIPWSAWRNGAIILGPLLPFLYYFGVYARRDPYWDAAQFTNNTILPPSPLSLLLGLGLLGILAGIGLWQWVRQGRDWLLPIWAIVNGLVLYVPVPFAGRFLLGLVLPVGVLAAYGLEEMVLPSLQKSRFFTTFSRLTPTPLATLRRCILILTIPSTMMVVVFLMQVSTLRQDFPVYLPQNEVSAAAWLAGQTGPEDVVLASYEVGNYLPRLVGSKVFLGHEYLTLDLAAKEALWVNFWQKETTVTDRQTFLETWGITYIVQGAEEQAVSQGEVVLPAVLVYEADGIRIYHLLPK